VTEPVPRSLDRIASVAGQLAMIAVGAYLGLQAEQWRENRGKAALARTTVRNFREEIAANRAAAVRGQRYHDSASAGLHRVFADQMRTGRRMTLVEVVQASGYDGTQTADFQTTAYELAVATQALGELPPALGFQLARVYTRQRSIAAFQDQFGQALLSAAPAPRDDATRALFMLDQGMAEIARGERRLVAAYDSILPRLDSALASRRP
jgi:hypothetical protein